MLNPHDPNEPKPREAGHVIFHPMAADEYNLPQGFGQQFPQQLGTRPKYRDYLCGSCGKTNSGRVVCDVLRLDGAMVSWCVCSCENKEPTIVVEKNGAEAVQLPQPKKFHADARWPKELADLYEEGAKAYAAGAFTATSMVCRKLLMSCACHEQDRAGEAVEEGKTFTFYVDYIISNVLTFPAARKPIDAIRSIGNEANHHVAFVTQPDAERSMTIVGHMLSTIYTFSQA